MAGHEREGHTDIWTAGPPTAGEKLEVSIAVGWLFSHGDGIFFLG